MNEDTKIAKNLTKNCAVIGLLLGTAVGWMLRPETWVTGHITIQDYINNFHRLGDGTSSGDLVMAITTRICVGSIIGLFVGIAFAMLINSNKANSS